MFPYSSSSSSTTMEGAYSFPLMNDLDEGLLGLSQQNQSLGMNRNPVCHHGERISAANMKMSSNNEGVGLVDKKRKKIGKKDRHSKICTAQGLRDRRMRLSVKVARKFFDLQDMLDLDKASKTIEWLLINSEAAIQQLARTSKSMSSCNSEVVHVSETNNNKEIESIKPKEKKKKKKVKAPIAKESRDKARARARDRTRDKIKLTHLMNKDSGFTTNSEATMTSKKPSLGNGPNGQEHSSIFMTISNGGPWNPSSLFWNAQDLHNPIPNSIFMNPNALELGIPSPLFTNSILNIGGTHFL